MAKNSYSSNNEIVFCTKCNKFYIAEPTSATTNTNQISENKYSCPKCGNQIYINSNNGTNYTLVNHDFLTGSTKIPYTNKNFIKILDFYLFNSPVRHYGKITNPTGNPRYINTFPKVSVRGKTFAERGIKGQNLRTLRSAMRRSSDGKIYDKTFIDENDILQNSIDPIGQPKREICLTLKNDSISQVDAIFYAIRNSLAHGSFCIDEEKYYYFESRNKGKLKARIRLKESTLLEWINLCKMNITQIKTYKIK
ncbi:MAG: hypothetical protein SPH06_07300 [Erysipelotrichaceae bacterium]|nr:hypothetical protein [Erysipelotrichaceae bacterium]